jgi:A/G-specific adenine glycosylase
MALWSGLGYYRRAENLKKAARIIVSQYKGKMPQQFGALRDLPGIGDYTAGAVTSIAFGQAYPALDANARRVLKRIFRVPEGKALKQLSTTLVPHSRPGDFNQGLMDLGAEICSTQKPDCPACPCKRLCRTRRYGPAEGNKLQRQAPRVEIVWPLAVITRKGMILLHRRPEKGLLAGLWELPGGRLFRGESPRVALARQLNDIGGIPGVMRVDREVRHSIMHYKIRAPVFVSSSGAVAIAPRGKRWRWVPLTSVGTYPMSSLSRKAIRLAVRPSHTTGASTVSGAATDTR